MTSKNYVERYLNATKRQLVCAKDSREKLLAGLMLELREVGPDADYDALCQTLGSPTEMAEQLMEQVDPAEIHTVRRKRRFVLGGVIATLLLFVGVSICGLFYAFHLYNYAQKVADNGYVVVDEMEVRYYNANPYGDESTHK